MRLFNIRIPACCCGTFFRRAFISPRSTSVWWATPHSPPPTASSPSICLAEGSVAYGPSCFCPQAVRLLNQNGSTNCISNALYYISPVATIVCIFTIYSLLLLLKLRMCCNTVSVIIIRISIRTSTVIIAACTACRLVL